MLVKYEFFKLLKKKSAYLIMTLSLLMTAFLFGLPILQYQTYSQNGAIKGLEGIAYNKKQSADTSVMLTEEYITNTIQSVQKLFEIPKNVGYDGNERFLVGNAYWKEIAPKEKLLNMIAKNYAQPNESVGYNYLVNINVDKGADFYKAMSRKLDEEINVSSRSMSKKQKEYWKKMADKVSIPLEYGYYEGWEVILNSFELLIFAVLAICIVIAPVFSGEYQAKTDAVILSGKYGKSKLIRAKITAAFLFAVAAFLLHLIMALGVPLLAFGIDGWNLPVQIANTAIPYPLSFFPAVLLNGGVVFLILLGMVSLTLLLSAKMKSPYFVLTVLIPVLFLPVLISPNGTSSFYNLILFLLPYRAAFPDLGKYISYQFGDIVLNAFAVRAIFYLALTVILIPLAGISFKNHQAA